jgi:hypothetical protein
MNFPYVVYNPHHEIVDVAQDWNLPNTTTDISVALAQPFRIAAVRLGFNNPKVYSYDPALASIDLKLFDLVLISDAEYHSVTDSLAWINSLGITNWLLAKGGYNPLDPVDGRIMYRPYWLSRFLSVNVYQDSSGNNKPFMFDALMGARRPHRDYVMMAATQSGLEQKSIFNYRTVFPGNVFDGQTREFAAMFPETKVNWPWVSPNLDSAWEVAGNIDNTISFISPVEIYRRCRYTIVTETLSTGPQLFFSEKSMKVLFNQRVFVMFAPPFFLQHLRDLGFQTFNGIIDETYDSITIDSERFKLAMQQAHILSWQNPDQIYAQAAAILEHNRARMQQLHTEKKEEMHRLLQQHIPSQHQLN